jgi:cytochrome c oxidase assembly factor CtaG
VVLFHVWVGPGGPSLLTSWALEPWQLVPTALLSFLYWRRTRTLARRGAPVPAWRQACFWLGIGLLLVALASPIDAFVGELFFMHMLQHVLLGDLAPLCVVLGLTGPVLHPVLRELRRGKRGRERRLGTEMPVLRNAAFSSHRSRCHHGDYEW